MISMMNIDLKKSAPLEIATWGMSVLKLVEEERQGGSPRCINCKMPLPTGMVIFGSLAVVILQVKWIFTGFPGKNHRRCFFI